MFYIKTKESKNIIFKNVQKNYDIWCTNFDENKEPVGMIIHWSILPKFLIDQDDGFGYYIYCKEELFDNMIDYDYNNDRKPIELDENFIPENDDEDDKEERIEKHEKLKYIMKTGEYGYFQYKTRKVNLTQIRPHEELHFYAYQDRLFKNIMNFYKNNNYCKVFLSGDPGCGKTYFAYMMAQKLGCYLCDSFDPYEPSSNFNEIYTLVKLDACCPLIILIDEVDVLIQKIHQKPIEEHKKFRREIYDKNSWNNFMDKIEYGLYPNVIVIMNSNRPKGHIDRMDNSYLRVGRINIVDKW